MTLSISKETIANNVVVSNVKEPTKAQVYLLLAKHSRSCISQEQRAQELFNCAFISQHFRDGDTIWVEESEAVEESQLELFQIPHLEMHGAKIRGWDDADACRRAKELEKKIASLSITQIHKQKSRFIQETFPTRQKELFKKIDLFIQENRGQLFILTGELHGDPSLESPFAGECLRFIEELKGKKISFTILKESGQNLATKSEGSDPLSKITRCILRLFGNVN